MAIFSNQATLTYNGGSTDSNIAYGEILDVLSLTKTAINDTYAPTDTITYVVTLRNTGTTDLTVTFNGAAWTQGVQYNYDPATGLFTTVPGQITVSAATYTQDPVTGEYTVTPGSATLVVTGTI